MNRKSVLCGCLHAATTAAALGLIARAATIAPGRASVTVVSMATTDTPGGYYTPNRSPLQPTVFQKLPAGSIRPGGWLRHQLQLDADGLSGRLPEVSDYLKYQGNGWVDPASGSGWEELTYWLRGYGDLGYVLGDAQIVQGARKWIDGILASQQPDGWFGPRTLRTSLDGGPDFWPHMPLLYALQSWNEYSGDARVIAFLTRYFKFQNAQSSKVFGRGWGAARWADDLQAVYWLYDRTGDAFLLDLAKRIHENSADYMDGVPTWHNVSLAQGIREPAEFWLQGHDAKFLAATEKSYDQIMGRYGQFPGGGFAGDENARPGFGDPRQGFETCGIVEFMNTFEIMTRITGNPLWADRCEELAFNSLPAAMTPDHKGIHYITCANSIQLDDTAKQHRQFQNGFAMQAYKPGIHDYRCCPHNYPMGWPFYAENLWLATSDRGLCASLYAASDVKAKVGDGVRVTLSENTDYPFRDTIRMTVATSRAVTFPLYLRVPGWCLKAQAKVNGRPISAAAGSNSYLIIDRTWKSGDTVTLRLPMRLSVRTWKRNRDAVSVDYGPLTYSLAVKESWKRFGGTNAWPEYDVLPTSAWNYGLEIDPKNPSRSIHVMQKEGALAAQPFTPETSPISLRARAKRIPGWQADVDNVVDVLQQSPVRSDLPTEAVTLIPMGAARLRITAFPTIGSGPDAHDWSAPLPPTIRATASHTNDGDTLDALDDGMEPASSADETIPRFTWWDHRGTSEWVQYDFTKPRKVSAVSVYWFDDTGHGGCRVPASWRLLRKDDRREWTPIEGVAAYDVARDRYDRVVFPAVTTTALRLEVRLQDGFSGGILEWKLE